MTRMVMHSLTTPPTDQDWIGLEDELAPMEVRRRIRGKISFNHLAVNSGEGEEKDDEKAEEEREEQNKKLRAIIQDEMRHAVEDDPHAAYATMDSVAQIKELTRGPQVEEILQTKIVSQHEVRRNLNQ